MSETKNEDYYNSLDKRTKEYKEWKAKFDASPSGLGDVIENITEKTGIKKVVKSVFGDDCGCDERKEKANKLLKLRPTECFTEQQFNDWTEFRNRKDVIHITPKQQELIKEILRDVFKMSVSFKCSSCSAETVKHWIRQIDKFYETYL